MREFVFYTEEGCTEIPTGETVENLQILGFAMGQMRRMRVKFYWKKIYGL